MFLKLLTDDEESYTLLYNFTIQNNPNWKESYALACKISKIKVPKQGSLSDYEYFKRLSKLQKEKSIDYLLLFMGMPVTSVRVFMRNPHIAEIAFVTHKDFQNKGYATKAVTMVEEQIFQNPDIVFTTITDLTSENISSKIAISLGYIFSPEHGHFVKFNPSLNVRDFVPTSR